MTLAIRPTVAADESAWRRLWRGYLAFYDTRLPEEIYAASFARLTDPAIADYYGLIAERGGEPVGIVNCIEHRHGWRLERVCYLQDLYVDPQARGTGAGRALIEAVYAEADRRGTPAVYWMTQDFNATARRLYDRVGRVTPFIKYQR